MSANWIAGKNREQARGYTKIGRERITFNLYFAKVVSGLPLPLCGREPPPGSEMITIMP
jgi:hypothetical protein